jgi:hypothetical protein
MKNSRWKFTAIEEGKPVATVHGLAHDEVIEAIRNAMYGSRPVREHVEELAERRERVEKPIAA